MSATSDKTPFGPCPAPFIMAAHVLAQGALSPDKIALALISATGADNWTYADLIAAVRGTGTGLLQAGLSPTDRVLLRLGNTPDFPIAYLGALAVGLVPVPTAAALTHDEVAKLITVLRPAAILHDADVPCPGFDKVLSLPELRAMRDLPPARWHMGDPNRLGYIIYTSGTSGSPMGVMHAHRAIWSRRMMFDGWHGIGATDRVLHAGAFNWTYTLGTGLMDPWSVGATALIPAAGTTSDQLPSLLKDHEATVFAAAPGVYRQMLKSEPRLHLPDLRHGLSAGEKMADPLRDTWLSATDTDVFEAFGMSECSTFISGSANHPATVDTMGRPQPGRHVCIMGSDGPAPAGTAGTIAIRGDDPGLMLGYLDAPEQTVARFHDGWFLTGDQGVADGDGQITYLGRNDEMMNAGGFRVSPLEVETILAQVPGVTRIGVTEVEVKPGVRVIAAFYTAPSALDERVLRAYATDTLARYKQPRLYIHLPELPQGANGKLQRASLRAAFEARKK